MVRRAALLPFLPLLLLALLLPGCSFFTASMFPGYLAQAEKSYDLSSRIDSFLARVGSADYRWYPQVFVLTSNAGVDYGGVLIEIDSRPDKMLLLADPAGNVQQLEEIALSTYYLGRLHLKAADTVNQFVVGQYPFPPGSLASAAPFAGITKEWLGFSDGSKNYLLWSESMYSDQLKWQSYNAGWSLAGSGSLIINDAQNGFEIRGVYYDALAANPVALVFFNYNLNQVHVFRTPVPDAITGTIATAYTPLIFSDVDAGNVHYTRKGIVLADYDGNAVLMDFSGNETDKKLDLGQRGDVRLALDIAGDHFYVFNSENQMLYMGKTGW
jgi:hypothetical protein